MLLLHKISGSVEYQLTQLPTGQVTPDDFVKVMDKHRRNGRPLYIQFEDQIVPVDKGDDLVLLAIFLSIHHNNTVTKFDRVGQKA